MKRRLGIALLACVLLASPGAMPTRGEPAEIPRDLTLRQCLEIALAHNPQLRQAATGFLAAEGRAIVLHAILYPSVNAQGLSTPLVFYVQIQETFYSRATLPQLRLSRLTHEQAYLNYRQTLADVVLQVRQAFTTALGAHALIEINRRLSANRDAAVQTAERLFSAGKLQRSDVLPLQVLASLARQNNTLATLTDRQDALSLSQALGVDLPDNVRLVGTLDDAGPANLDTAMLTTQALRDRQDLKLLENAQLEAGRQIEIDLKDAYPNVGFESDSAIQPPSFLPGGTGGYDLERNYDEPETQRQAGDTQLPLSLYMNWRVFDGGNLAGVKQSDRARMASRQAAIDALRRSIPGEVAQAVAAIVTERTTLRLLQEQPATTELQRDAETEYQAGRVRLLDKVNLDSDIVRQRQLRLAGRIRLCLALAALDHALGRDLETPRSPSP